MKYRVLYSIVISSILCSCQPNKLDVDISDIKTVPLKTMRLEDDLFSLNESNFETKTAEIEKKYGVFYDRYLMNPLRIGGTKDTMYKKLTLMFLHDKEIRESYQYVKKTFPNTFIDELTNESNDCVKRFKYHFPKRMVPTKLITCVTGWNYSTAYTDSALVIGLDMYLGDTAKFYEMLRYPKYQIKNMNKNYILSDMVRGWMLTEFDNSDPVNTLLNHTIFYGKLYYAVNALLPNTQDSILIAYSTKQMKYCKEYEKKLWGYFAEKNRLYENNLKTLRELTSEGPFTGAISSDCPPRIAMWVGWQIVKSYMKNSKELSLEDLMNEKDAQKILSKSKYRP